MSELCNILNRLLDLYMLILMAYCIFSFLLSFGVVNPNSNAIRSIYIFLSRACDPILNIIRQALPSLGTIDISPIIVFLIIRYVIQQSLLPYIFG